MVPESAGAAPRCGICAAIARIAAGDRESLIAELPQSFVVLGDSQFYRGYCLMFARRHVSELFLMAPDESHALLDEMTRCAAAISAVVKPSKMNYECLGNVEPHVHWHLIPRYADDPMRSAPIWSRPDSERNLALPRVERQALIEALRAETARRIS